MTHPSLSHHVQALQALCTKCAELDALLREAGNTLGALLDQGVRAILVATPSLLGVELGYGHDGELALRAAFEGDARYNCANSVYVCEDPERPDPTPEVDAACEGLQELFDAVQSTRVFHEWLMRALDDADTRTQQGPACLLYTRAALDPGAAPHAGVFTIKPVTVMSGTTPDEHDPFAGLEADYPTPESRLRALVYLIYSEGRLDAYREALAEMAKEARAMAAAADDAEASPIDTLRCRYDDCVEQHPLTDTGERVTCPTCREALGLPAVEEADG